MIDARVMRLREMAIKGGEATRRKMLDDPDYFKRIGRLGGVPSHVHPRKARKRKRVRKPVVKAAPVVAVEEKPMTKMQQVAIDREATKRATAQRLAAVAEIESC